ncbi:hypothetical protein PILCRDRAFT_369582 [Piloderma croceum F 1598]|uniref:Uncharacterized protein n=1 Tax=Piloderma croceum (strain F 1598) TaxID=765440 RepID=A0A0C3FL98_PILCF|nr:hypothetical protein PILCRDRAFT_369582 [Piloderma croceum F 1598]
MSFQKDLTSSFLINSNSEALGTAGGGGDSLGSGKDSLGGVGDFHPATNVETCIANDTVWTCCANSAASSFKSPTTPAGLINPNTFSKLTRAPNLLVPLLESLHIDKWSLILLRTSPILSREATMLGWRVDALWESESGERMRWTRLIVVERSLMALSFLSRASIHAFMVRSEERMEVVMEIGSIDIHDGGRIWGYTAC